MKKFQYEFRIKSDIGAYHAVGKRVHEYNIPYGNRWGKERERRQRGRKK